MTQKNKELLLKDLCARLSYGVKCQIEEGEHIHIGTLCRVEIDKKNGHLLDFVESINYLDCQFYISEVKPYLFPLSSMTEEQKSYLYFNTNFEVDMFGKLVVKMDADDNYLYTDLSDYTSIINWLIENKFDYQGLIPKGLAIDATGLNIY
jgi:hypothetical protein